MANRYIRNAGGNWNTAGTWELTAGGGESVLVPTAADEVLCTATSGNLVVNASAVCRSLNLTGYTGTISGSFALTIGDATAPTGGIILKLAGTVTYSGTITFASTNNSTHTINLAGKTLAILTFSPASGTPTFQFVASTPITVTGVINHTAGTIDFNNNTVTSSSGISTTGATARTLTFGSMVFTTTYTSILFTYTGSNLTITANTAMFVCNAATGASIQVIDGINMNGSSFKIMGSGGFTFSNTITIQDLILDPSADKTLAITSAKTVTLNGTLYHRPKGGSVTWTGGTLSKTTGTVEIYNMINTSCTFSGGATWNCRNNCTLTVVSGLTLLGGNFYIDLINGSDTPFNAYGFYKVAYTDASGTCPVIDELVTGATSGKTAKISYFDPLEWALGAGTLYFSYKTGSFATDNATQINCAGGGHFHISAADFITGAWLTVTSGALTSRISAGDKIRIAESSDPTSIGNGSWTNAPNVLSVAKSITSSATGSPIQINATGHGYSNGDIVQIYSHTINTTANGVWTITWVSANAFTLDGSVGVGTGGATGSAILTSRAVVKLTTTQTKNICACQVAWTPSGSSTITYDTTYYKNGAGSVKIVKASPANNTLYGYIATGTLDLSSYQKISFWLTNLTAILANQWTLCLCSDTAGAVITDEFAIPVVPSTYGAIALTLIRLRWSLAFTGGDITQPHIGEPITQGSITGIVDSITITSGSFAGGDAVGTLYIRVKRGAFVSGQINYEHGGHSHITADAVVNNGGNLGVIEGGTSAVKSIALYSGSSAATTTGLQFSNIIVCTTSGLNLLSLISKNTLKQSTVSATGYGNEAWYGIKNISEDSKLLYLDNGPNASAVVNNTTRGCGYVGATENVTTYVRETIKTIQPSGATNAISTTVKSGLAGYLIEYQGGWSTSLFNTQAGVTFFDGSSANGYGFNIASHNYIKINHLCFTRYNYGIYINNASYCVIDTLEDCNNCHNTNLYVTGTSYYNTFTTIINCNNSTAYGIYILSACNTITTLFNCSNNITTNLYLSASVNLITTITNCNNGGTYNILISAAHNNMITTITNCSYGGSSGAIYFTNARNNIINEVTLCNYCSSYAVHFYNYSNDNVIKKITTSNGVSALGSSIINTDGINYIQNAIYNESAPLGSTQFSDAQLWSLKEGGVTGTNKGYFYGAIASLQTGTVHSTEPAAWKIALTASTGVYRDTYYPVKLKVAEIACEAGTPVTISSYAKKDHGSQVACRLVIYADAITGVTLQESICPSDTNWNNLSITVTASTDGVFEVWFETWYVSAVNNTYIGALTIS